MTFSFVILTLAGKLPGLAPGALRVTLTVSFLRGTAEVFLIGCVEGGCF